MTVMSADLGAEFREEVLLLTSFSDRDGPTSSGQQRPGGGSAAFKRQVLVLAAWDSFYRKPRQRSGEQPNRFDVSVPLG